LRQSREDDDVNEISLRQFQEELERLTKELTKPRNISIREDSTSFINKIYVDVSGNSTTLLACLLGQERKKEKTIVFRRLYFEKKKDIEKRAFSKKTI
jgi:hypothetical protein